MISWKSKYLKYKLKYLNLINQKGGSSLQYLAANKLLKQGVTPKDLHNQKYPDDITDILSKVEKTNNIIDNAIQRKTKKNLKTQLKHRFQLYNNSINYNYDPKDNTLPYLTEMAAKLLTKKDFNDKFWKDVLGNILIALHDNPPGGPFGNRYKNTEKHFKTIIYNVLDYDIINSEFAYLNDYYLHNLLVEPLVEEFTA